MNYNHFNAIQIVANHPIERGLLYGDRTEHLLREIKDIHTNHKRRRWIGERLTVIGNDRSGIGLDERGLPQIGGLPVLQAEDIEVEGRFFTVRTFYIAKCLITYQQFYAFLLASHFIRQPHTCLGGRLPRPPLVTARVSMGAFAPLLGFHRLVLSYRTASSSSANKVKGMDGSAVLRKIFNAARASIASRQFQYRRWQM